MSYVIELYVTCIYTYNNLLIDTIIHHILQMQMRMIQDSIPSILQDVCREREAARVELDSLGYAIMLYVYM
jgi:hypothetical protein